MPFQFIEEGGINPATRKVIRSHVMRGKNVGKIRSRPRIQQGEEDHLCVAQTRDSQMPNTQKNHGRSFQQYASIPRSPGNIFAFCTFPCENLQPYMLNLVYQIQRIIDHVYPPEFCTQIDSMKQVWFQYVLSDEAFFHASVAVSELITDKLQDKDETSPKALHHLSATYRCISQRLQRDASPSDATIASVVSMAIHEDFKGQPARSKVHIDGLQQLVVLRGGIDFINTNILLLQKICRADIRYALHTGARPRFLRHQISSQISHCILRHQQMLPNNSDETQHLKLYNPELRSVTADIASACYLFNDEHRSLVLEHYEFQDILTSLYYRILWFCPLSDAHFLNINDAAVYIGLLALLSTTLFQTSELPHLEYDLLKSQARVLLASNLVDEVISFWLLFVCGISIYRNNQIQLVPIIKMYSSTYKLRDWEKARAKFGDLPWINTLHNELGNRLWDMCQIME